jgi:hypothetical protein
MNMNILQQLPSHISIVFVLTVFATVHAFAKASPRPYAVRMILFAWLVLQGAIAYAGFYQVTGTIPPRIMVMILPAFLTVVLFFLIPSGRRFIDGFSMQGLLLLHIIRIPIEVVLYWLSVQKVIPTLMTFEGRNFDVLSGLSAPVMYYFVYMRGSLNKKWLMPWNIICLMLLMNIVINAALSTPTVFQQFAFDQSNIAILNLPFNWLPCCVVPIVFFAHLISIRRLIVHAGE